LGVDDLQGGTFTITNLGTYGIDAFTPIINLPQCAILGVGRIIEKPAVVDGQLVPRKMMALSLTFDHRVVDGGPAARFLNTIREYVEQPYSWLTR
jgi:pyruvate dehydrogenase E2 component (dihydrolipoamide acetyltransferase)